MEFGVRQRTDSELSVSGAAMARCAQSVQEFIQDSFVPMVAVLCSDDAERLTRKNSLSFPELLRPFCRLTSEGTN